MTEKRSNVLLLVTGGIAAYKSCYLTRLLIKAGFSVRVAMTESAQHFVGSVTFRTLSGHGVATDLWGEGDTDPLDHVDLARWADIAVVAPATANLLGKAAGGIADDIVSTLMLAFDGRLILAPAMNNKMWHHPATQSNLNLLCERGATIVEPESGWLACGVEADGRMAEPEVICQAVEELEADSSLLAGKKIVVTAGPTREKIDAIRYISNRSTGAFGTSIATAAKNFGADVTLIHGPLCVRTPGGMKSLLPVESASEMFEAVQREIADADMLVMCAAVADYSPLAPSDFKLKKDDLGDNWSVEMKRTTDILASIDTGDTTVVGFALETDDVAERAAGKLSAKGMDYIVANDPVKDGSFGENDHHVLLIDSSGIIWDSGVKSKKLIAPELLKEIAKK
ncbi:MAG: bifunctional phosphopantothenoylcysteine decarboxylase/phosphopantothenate--cysteine ligase CoaBC [bacterium]|nr:bifunctional phosphopantothenoylcysteine decarboxylase/phosphopantothenate--cysteine ligase CoaBC [bacterium]MCP4800940.1 bifunctional phosphopantothenoylcysteine decarboxylase/phosphopantothenate--cysteine ligase CoaBC [bacterium]